MSVPSDTNVSLKIFEKLSKYKDLEIEVTKMWHLKTTTLPLFIGALGIVSRTVLNYISQIPGALSLTELQHSWAPHISCESYYQCNLCIYIISDIYNKLQT